MLIETTSTDRSQGNGTSPNGDNGRRSSFEELLEHYEPKPLHQGQYVRGKILQIDQNVILADVAAKRTAIIPPKDLERIEEHELSDLSVGDEVSLFVLRTPEADEDLLVSLNKGLEQRDWSRAKEILDEQEILELEVAGHNKGGLLVAFGRLRGFVPASHVPQLRTIRNQQAAEARKAELVGETLPLRVIEVDRDRQRLILSAKQARKELRLRRLQELKLQEGDTIKGQVNGLVDFGAFVELGGVEGLIHISEIAWQMVEDPAEFLNHGEEVEVLVRSVDLERERISLSRKALLPNPWDQFAQVHDVGDLLEGVVTSVTDFGAFVLVSEGVDGLIHVSEMNGAQNVAPQDALYPGDAVLVRILNIDPDEQRLGLSQRRVSQLEEMEWIWRLEKEVASAGEEE